MGYIAIALGTTWGRGAGEGIGLSGHKNEYGTGVRIGNWVEEQFATEADGHGHKLNVRNAYVPSFERKRLHCIPMVSVT